MDGEVIEDGKELNEDQEKDLDGIKLEVVEGNKEGSRWLIVDSVHICHKQQMFLNHDVWRCEDFRDYKCPFKIITIKEESENGLKIVTITKKTSTQLFEGQSEANLAQVQIEIVQTDEGRFGHTLEKDMG